MAGRATPEGKHPVPSSSSPATVVAGMRRNPRSNTDLAAAAEAAAKASAGPDLDHITEEIVEMRRRSHNGMSIEALTPKRPIGMGGQGGVWLAHDPSSGLWCAVKQIRKGRLSALPRKAATRAITEREALIDVSGHPFITECYSTFQDATSLFFAIELAPAGDLFGLLDVHPNGLPEVQARFYNNGVALALRHIHAHGWVYRDVKLENVLIDADGYVKICDFGFAKKTATSRTYTKCGTDEYAPPEVVSGRGRSCAADWWALGILLHEMLTGRPPFEGSSAEEVFDSISEFSNGGAVAAAELQRALHKAAESISKPCAAYLMGLLQAKEADRIGAGPAGFLEIQQHEWLADVDWEGLLRKELPAPWVPHVAPDSAVDAGVQFSGEDVMAERPYDAAAWEPVWKDFGPHRQAPWEEI